MVSIAFGDDENLYSARRTFCYGAHHAVLQTVSIYEQIKTTPDRIIHDSIELL